MVLTGDALHREILTRFAAPQPSKAVLPLCAPIEHEGGVIEWSPSHLGAFLLRVVGERVIQLGVARDDGDAPKDALVRWLAAFDPRALDLVSDTQPLRYLEGSPIAPLTGHAVVHPSLAGAGPSQLTIELLTGRLYRLSFVHRSEIAEDMDAKWAKAQLTDLRGGPARAPCSAFRSARSKPGAKKPAPLTLARPQAVASEVSKVLDPRLGDAHVRAIVDGCYLHALTRHHHRGKASTIRITTNDGVGGTFEYAYPPAKVAR